MNKYKKNQTGVILLLTLFILSGILIVTLAAADLVLSGLKMNRLTGYSSLAFFAAEAGLERALWEARKNTYVLPNSDADNVFSLSDLGNGSAYRVDYAISSPNVTFTSIGSYRGAKRSVESTYITGALAFSCGSNLVVTHTAGAVAPVTKTVTYGTVLSSLGGTGAKCWITQNLGADNQAASATDNTEASAGWYWQFNRMQGYKHDGTTRTPNTAWIYPIDENSDWVAANDPCALLLGAGWRLPIKTEWNNADTNGAWGNDLDAYASVFKLHDAGVLLYNTGALNSRGTGGLYWSSSESSSVAGWGLVFDSDSGLSYTYDNEKDYGASVRCLKD